MLQRIAGRPKPNTRVGQIRLKRMNTPESENTLEPTRRHDPQDSKTQNANTFNHAIAPRGDFGNPALTSASDSIGEEDIRRYFPCLEISASDDSFFLAHRPNGPWPSGCGILLDPGEGWAIVPPIQGGQWL